MDPVVATQTDQTNEGGSQKSTLQNLDANMVNELDNQQNTNSQTGDSAGDTTPASTDAQGTPPSSQEPAAADTQVNEDPAEVAGRATRISQDNADLRKTLEAIGINPDGADAEQLRGGFLDPKEFIKGRYASILTPDNTSQASEPAATTVSLDQKLIDIQQALKGQKGREITGEEYQQTQTQLLDVVQNLVTANKEVQYDQRGREIKDLQTRNIAATNETFNQTASANIPQDLREDAADLVLGSTDIAVGKLAQQVGSQRAITPEGYAHEAKTASEKLNRIVEAAYKAGQTAAITNISPPGRPLNPVVPLQPGGGGTPIPQVNKPKMNLDNLDANAEAYMASQEAQV